MRSGSGFARGYLNGGRGEDYPIFAERLERDGWQTEKEFTGGRNSRSDQRVLTLPQPGGETMLVMHAHATSERLPPGFGCYFETYALRRPDGGVIELPGVEWADWDHRGRLVFARHGQVFAAMADGSDERLLFKTLDDRPDPVAPPPEAVAPADLTLFEVPPPRPAQWHPEPRRKKKRNGSRRRPAAD